MNPDFSGFRMHPDFVNFVKCHENGAIFFRTLPVTSSVKKYITGMLIRSIQVISTYNRFIDENMINNMPGGYILDKMNNQNGTSFRHDNVIFRSEDDIVMSKARPILIVHFI